MLRRFFSGKSENISAHQQHQKKSSSFSTNTTTDNDSIMVAVIDENERFKVSVGWSHENLLPTDPMRYKYSSGESTLFPNPPLAEGWDYFGDWEIDAPKDNKDNEWVYASSFEDIYAGKISLQPKEFVVRRKRWIRTVKSTNPSLSDKFLQSHQSANYYDGDLRESPKFSSNFKESDEDDAESEYEPSESDLANSDINFELESDRDENMSVMDSDETNFYARKKSFAFGMSRQASTSVAISSSIHSPSSDIVLRIKDTNLTNLGRVIRNLEMRCENMDNIEQSDWAKYKKPTLKLQITELEKYCKNLHLQIESQVHRGLEVVSKLEDELNTFSERLETIKKKFYFPDSKLSFGQNGIYVAFDDFWLENISGQFDLEMAPSKINPYLRLVVNGTDDRNRGLKSKGSGMMIRMKIDKFKLAGDKGKRIPKITLDNLKVTVCLRVNIVLTFDSEKSKWVTNSKSFQIELVSFKGPYGMTKSVVGTILALVIPLIRSQIINSLPVELGLFLKTLPSPFTVSGEFDITGPELDILSTNMEKCHLLHVLSGYSPFQMEMFHWMQKSLDRPKLIRNMTDFLTYFKTYSKHELVWKEIVDVWNEACNLYSSKVTTIRHESSPSFNSTNNQESQISFDIFLSVAEDFNRKRLGAFFQLQHIDGQLSINQVVKFANDFIYRTTLESMNKSTGSKKVRLKLALENIKESNEFFLQLIRIVSNNIDFGQLKSQFVLNAGPSGKMQLFANDIMAQIPLILSFNLTKEKTLGHAPLVPYLLRIKPQSNGDLEIEINHMSKEGLESAKPIHDYKFKGISMDENNEGNLELHKDSMDSSEKSGSFSSYYKGVSSTSKTPTDGSQPSYSSPYGTSSRGDRRKQALSQTLNSVPMGDNIDTIMLMKVSQPHISMIVDRPITLKPGSEIFTFFAGPRPAGWVPFGSEDMSGVLSDPSTPSTTEHVKNDQKEVTGCPILIQTGPGIKIMSQVPNAEATVNLPALVRFINMHFQNTENLKTFIENLTGSEIFEENLQLLKDMIDRIQKYLLLPGLNIEMNVNGRLVAINNEIMIRIETPDFFNYASKEKAKLAAVYNVEPSLILRRTDSTPTTSNSRVKPINEKLCAIKLRAEMNLMDIIEDSKALDESMRAFVNESEDSSA